MVQWVLSDKQIEYIDDRTDELMIEGSAGSGKTIFACSKTIKYALTYEGARVGVYRATLPSLRDTAWREIRELLMKYDIDFEENKSNGMITLPNKSTISFKGLDDLRKARSLNMDFIYIEQAEEIDRDTYIELKLRLRNKVYQEHWGQMLLVVQPEMKSHWLYDYFYRKGNGKHVHFHYSENPFLPQDIVEYYERLKDIDEDAYIKYTLGEWGTSSSQVYPTWDTDERKVFEYYTAGIDWGWNSPSCFLLVGWFDDEAYILDEIYQTHMTTSEFNDRVKLLLYKYNLDIDDVVKIYADNANPEAIHQFYMADFNIVPADKNVSDGIMTTKMTKFHIAKRCENTIFEIQNYEWEKDKNGDETDKPRKINDHAMDALRYCIYGVRGGLSFDRPASNFDLSEVYCY